MSKNFKKYVTISVILIVLYNVLVLVIPYPKQNIQTFIISYIASMIAFLIQPIIYFIAFYNKDSLKSKLYGIPVLKVGYIYGIVQLCISVLFYILGAFVNIPTWISAVIAVILIGLAVIGILVTDTYREEIEKIEASVPVSKTFISNLRIDSESFASKITAEPIHSKLVKFSDLVKYSDPVSSDSLIEIENEINRKYSDIKELVINEKVIEAINELKEITVLMEERNNMCKSTKNG